MIYEIRTYNLKTGNLHEYWKRFGEKLPGREGFSRLGGHWYTEVGILDQMIAIWPYENLSQRAQIRQLAEAGPQPKWPPNSAELIIDMVSHIYHPAPFMEPLSPRTIGPLYEMRFYTYPVEVLPQVIETWAKHIDKRITFSPLAGCWYSENGGPDNLILLWAYTTFEQRLHIRQEVQAKRLWPPSYSAKPIRQTNKILFPAPFSPMQ